jgi:hypothetical protein
MKTQESEIWITQRTVVYCTLITHLGWKDSEKHTLQQIGKATGQNLRIVENSLKNPMFTLY